MNRQAYLEKLAKLEKEATEGPWKQVKTFWVECEACGEENMCCDVADCSEYQPAYIQACGMETFAKPVAAFIAESRTAVPVLLEAIQSYFSKVGIDENIEFDKCFEKAWQKVHGEKEDE